MNLNLVGLILRLIFVLILAVGFVIDYQTMEVQKRLIAAQKHEIETRKKVMGY